MCVRACEVCVCVCMGMKCVCVVGMGGWVCVGGT